MLRVMYKSICVFLMVFLAAVGTGCNKKTEFSSSSPIKREIQNGGQVVYGSLQEPDTLNPLFSEYIAAAEVGSLVFSGLVISNDKGEWIPDLAAQIPTVKNGGVSRDGLVVTYHLRQGVTWHDGATFSAEDVKFTWQVIMNNKNPVILREGYNKIAAIDTPDANTVIIRFKEYYAPYLTLFTTILPKHILANSSDISKSPFNRAPVGTGPFKLKEWRIAEAIIFEANTAYFRGRPKLDGVVYKFIPDSNLLLNQLKSGEIDIAGNLAFILLDQVKGVAGINTIITPNMIWEHIDLNLDKPIFQDVRVRKAIALAIDRQAIINSAIKNAATPAATDQSPLSWAYNPALKAPTRDVNAARELLEQAGWKLGNKGVLVKETQTLAFQLVTTGKDRVREIIVQNIAEQLKEVGIGVEIQYVDAPILFSDVLKNRRFDAAMYSWVTGMDPDNVSFWHSKQIPSAMNGYSGQNYSGWRNSEIDTLTEQGLYTVDTEVRKQIYFRIQDIISQEYPVIPLYFRANIDVAKPIVANFKPNPTPGGNFWNAWEWGMYTK